MKRRKTLILLVCVLAAVSIATVVVMRTEEKKEEIKNTDEVILAVDPADVTSVSWTCEDSSFAFEKEEDEWLWSEDSAFPVSSDTMTEMLGIFEEFGASFVIENVDDFAQYGLDEPVCTINFSTEDADYEVQLGDFSSMDSERYVSIGDGNVYLVSTDPYDSYDVEISDMILDDEVPGFENGIESMSLEVKTITGSDDSEDTESFSYELVYDDEDTTTSVCADDHYFTEVNGTRVPLDSSSVYAYYSAIRNLGLDSYVSYNVTDDELTDWGLDDPELTITVSYTPDEEDSEDADSEDADSDEADAEASTDTFILQIGRNQEELAKSQNADETDFSDVTCYARVGDSPIIYTIDESTYETLMACSYNDLRHEEVMTADMDTIQEIQVSLEGSDYTLTRSTEEDDDDETYTAYSYHEEVIDGSDLETAISTLEITEFLSESDTSDISDSEEEISLTITLDNEDHPEMQINIYRYDGSSCLVSLNGETLGLTERSQVVDLIEAVHSIVLG